MMPRCAGPFTRSILSCSPEQPPPMTATRSRTSIPSTTQISVAQARLRLRFARRLRPRRSSAQVGDVFFALRAPPLYPSEKCHKNIFPEPSQPATTSRTHESLHGSQFKRLNVKRRQALSAEYATPDFTSGVFSWIGPREKAGSIRRSGFHGILDTVDYGTQGQTGNTCQWTETTYDGRNDTYGKTRIQRGGSYCDLIYWLPSSFYFASCPVDSGVGTGLRVASVVPVPDSTALLAGATLNFSLRLRRNSRGSRK